MFTVNNKLSQQEQFVLRNKIFRCLAPKNTRVFHEQAKVWPGLNGLCLLTWQQFLAELCHCPASVISLRLLQWDRRSQTVAHISVVFHTVGNNLI